MIAHLPMYDVAANRDAHGRLWQGFFKAMELPNATSTQPGENLLADWLSPDLLLSQTCGLPFRARLRGRVQYVATPDYRLPNCPPGHYRSAIIARQGEYLDLQTNDFTMAVNDGLSQSGWAAPWAEGITGNQQVMTGAHAKSALAVLDGQADVASIDALTWYLLQRDCSGMSALTVLHWTRPTPVLPYITALTQDAVQVRSALRQAIDQLSAQDQEQLQLFGIVDLPEDNYCEHPIPPVPNGTHSQGLRR